MDIENAVQEARRLGASYAEARHETVEENRLQMQDGELRGLVAGTTEGFGLRVLVNGAWGMASSNDLATMGAAVRDAVGMARAVASQGRPPVRLADVPALRANVTWAPKIDPRKIAPEEKISVLRHLDSTIRAVPGIGNVTAAATDATVTKHLVTSDGTDLRWSLVRTVVQSHFTAKGDGQLAGRSSRIGGTAGWEILQGEDPAEKAKKAAQAAVAALGAPAAKGGRRTVVIDHELAGVFAHEAVGHASEADLITAGESCFKGRMGQKLGIDGLAIRDDSTIPGAFGSFPFDDSGVAGASKPILDNGVLVGYLADRENGAELGVRPNGAARAQDYGSRPLVRMSNTMIAPGSHSEEEVFAGIKDGIYCKGSRGGQVDCARGTFLFNAQEAYRIEDGVVTTPLRDVSLTGDILSTLTHITALGNRARMGDPGYCGKGQWVPVCDGGPLVRIADCLVGGTA
ncbi:MAG: TldD/PmbA family protein [Candidatus Thermoplasmatota archaeon]